MNGCYTALELVQFPFFLTFEKKPNIFRKIRFQSPGFIFKFPPIFLFFCKKLWWAVHLWMHNIMVILCISCAHFFCLNQCVIVLIPTTMTLSWFQVHACEKKSSLFGLLYILWTIVIIWWMNKYDKLGTSTVLCHPYLCPSVETFSFWIHYSH